MAALRDALLVGYVRTAFGRADPRRGVFRQVRSDDLAVSALHERCCAAPASAAGDVDGVILGAVEMMGEQAHPGTAIPFLAGFPEHVVGLSIERACTHRDDVGAHRRRCRSSAASATSIVAGGLDSMTHFRIPTIKDGMDMDDGHQGRRPHAGRHESQPEAVRAASTRSS